MTEFEVNELEEMFKRRCTQHYEKLLKYRADNKYNEFYKIISYCFENYKKIKNSDDLRKTVMNIDEYYWYDYAFIDCLINYCNFLNLYRRFVDKYRILYDDEDTDLHYYTKYDDEYYNF